MTWNRKKETKHWRYAYECLGFDCLVWYNLVWQDFENTSLKVLDTKIEL